jgi:hypothetical protein
MNYLFCRVFSQILVGGKEPSCSCLCPFCENESILKVDAKVANRILDLGMDQHDLHGSKVAPVREFTNSLSGPEPLMSADAATTIDSLIPDNVSFQVSARPLSTSDIRRVAASRQPGERRSPAGSKDGLSPLSAMP